MLFQLTFALLVSTALSASLHGLRGPASVLRKGQTVAAPVSQISGTQPFESVRTEPNFQSFDGIPAGLGTPLTATFFEIPQSIPQHLISLQISPNFEIPQTIPKNLLSLSPSAPLEFNIVSAQPLAKPLSVLSPVQKAKSTPLTPALPQLPAVPQLSNVFTATQNTETRSETGFSTPSKPLSFAPNLPEVQKPKEKFNQRVETPEPIQQKVEQRLQTQEPIQQQRLETPEPIQQRVEQRLETPEPIQQRVEQRLETPEPIQQRVEQRFESQAPVQQRVESFVQPLPQTTEQLPAPVVQRGPPKGLNSY